MTVEIVNFARHHRDREEYLIALADAVMETVGVDPADYGPVTADDLLDCEADVQTGDPEDEFVRYRYAVGMAVGQPGRAIDIEAYRDPANHARALAKARDYLARVNSSFAVTLGARR